MKDTVLNYIKTQLTEHPEWKYSIGINYWQTDFLRFYHSQTNYNISKENVSLDISIFKEKKTYSFNIDQPTPDRIDTAIANTVRIIDFLPEDPDFVDVEDDLTKNNEKQKINCIEAVSLDKKISILQEINLEAEKLNFELFGTFICNYQHHQILNSNGLDKQYWNSPIYLEVKAVNKVNQVTVLETFGGENFSLYNNKDFIYRIIRKMQNALNDVVDVEPGEFDVILAPRCIAEYMQFLSGSMTARSVDQKSSFFEGKLDKQVFPEYVSITDDPSDHELITFDYNHDGHCYNRMALVGKGVFKNFMCDKYYHHKTGLPKNGNIGSCLVLHPGSDSLDDLFKSVKKGLYISSLHYMNWINVKETSVTGLTRDGTFLIENGKITKVVNSLRFTEKISRIFENIAKLENKCYTIPFSENYEFFGIESSKAPHVLVKNFNITSSTKTI